MEVEEDNKIYELYEFTNRATNNIYIATIDMISENEFIPWKKFIDTGYFFEELVKYGWNNFDRKILGYGLTKKEALFLEAHYIKMYNVKKIFN